VALDTPATAPESLANQYTRSQSQGTRSQSEEEQARPEGQKHKGRAYHIDPAANKGLNSPVRVK